MNHYVKLSIPVTQDYVFEVAFRERLSKDMTIAQAIRLINRHYAEYGPMAFPVLLSKRDIERRGKDFMLNLGPGLMVGSNEDEGPWLYMPNLDTCLTEIDEETAIGLMVLIGSAPIGRLMASVSHKITGEVLMKFIPETNGITDITNNDPNYIKKRIIHENRALLAHFLFD